MGQWSTMDRESVVRVIIHRYGIVLELGRSLQPTDCWTIAKDCPLSPDPVHVVAVTDASSRAYVFTISDATRTRSKILEHQRARLET